MKFIKYVSFFEIHLYQSQCIKITFISFKHGSVLSRNVELHKDQGFAQQLDNYSTIIANTTCSPTYQEAINSHDSDSAENSSNLLPSLGLIFGSQCCCNLCFIIHSDTGYE